MKLQIKLLLLALTLAGWCNVATAQKYLTKQSEVDSFAQIMHAKINITLHLRYDSTLSANDRIKDLSAYDSLRLLRLVVLKDFLMADVPWFKGHSPWANFTFINMPNLTSLSGIRESIGEITFDNCPAIAVYPPVGSVKKNNNLTIKNTTKKTIRVDTKNMTRNEPRYNWIHIIDCNMDTLLIDDSGGSIYKYVVKNNPTLKLWKTKGGYSDVYLRVDSNPNLEYIQGFDKLYMARIGEEYGIRNCSRLSNLCDIREPLDSFYRFSAKSR
ncbi:MAG: hypothetical protein KDC83_05390 [Flavobacteriales bacterium]|nr:hypothetical protein [Flavobacteriales bacterium]